MYTRIVSIILLSCSVVLCCVNASAAPLSNVVINGVQLSHPQLQALETNLGSRIVPGIYLVDLQGCWLNMGTGERGCIGSINTYSRYGSGERTSDGSWNHYSNSAEMGVGGTSDGCIYTTTGWSNC